jgi:hypothetical protein
VARDSRRALSAASSAAGYASGPPAGRWARTKPTIALRAAVPASTSSAGPSSAASSHSSNSAARRARGVEVGPAPDPGGVGADRAGGLGQLPGLGGGLDRQALVAGAIEPLALGRGVGIDPALAHDPIGQLGAAADDGHGAALVGLVAGVAGDRAVGRRAVVDAGAAVGLAHLAPGIALPVLDVARGVAGDLARGAERIAQHVEDREVEGERVLVLEADLAVAIDLGDEAGLARAVGAAAGWGQLARRDRPRRRWGAGRDVDPGGDRARRQIHARGPAHVEDAATAAGIARAGRADARQLGASAGAGGAIVGGHRRQRRRARVGRPARVGRRGRGSTWRGRRARRRGRWRCGR